MKLTYFKLALKCDSFDVTIGIKVLFFRVSVTIEPGHSLLQFVTTNCLTRLKRTGGHYYKLFKKRADCRLSNKFPTNRFVSSLNALSKNTVTSASADELKL